MHIIFKDLRNDRIKILTENLNDLWHLQHIIEPEDIITATTWRREESEDDKIRSERREKKRTKLSLRVKKIKFHKFSNKLRILGEIEKGPDIGSHHTINVDTNSKLTITKEWRQDHLDRLEEAIKASKRPKVLLVAVDDEKATFGLVRQYGLQELGEINSTVSGKMYESDKQASESEYYQKTCFSVKNHMDGMNIPSVIIAGPGFTKKKIYSMLKEENPKIAEKTHLGNTSGTGRPGLNEIIRRGIVKRVSEEDRTSLETELIEEMFEEIAKKGKATYGLGKIKGATKEGAVEKLLISDKKLRNNRDEVEPVIENGRSTGADVYVISSEHEAGKKLLRIGGIGALLRYKTS